MSARRTSARSSSISRPKKILALQSLLRELRKRTRRKERVVFTNGVFDILHAGHVRYLKAARNLGDCLVVAVNSDESARRLKGPARPIIPQRDRAELLAALECVDYVTIFSDLTPARLIAAVVPRVLVKGADWRTGDIVGNETLKKTGGRVVRIPLAKGRSTTDIIRRIISRRISIGRTA